MKKYVEIAVARSIIRERILGWENLPGHQRNPTINEAERKVVEELKFIIKLIDESERKGEK